MNPLSDRQHDSFDNRSKMAGRKGNLRVLREAVLPSVSRERRDAAFLLSPLALPKEIGLNGSSGVREDS